MSETKYRLLAVDDEQTSLRLLKRLFFEDEDIEVVTTDSPIEALRLASAQTFHVVISDQLMPGMTGVELLARLAQTQPMSIRIMLTAFPQLSAVLRAVNDGQIYKFLTKPCDMNELRTIVRSALRMISANNERDEMLQYLSQQLVRTEKLAEIGRHVAGIAHDIGNPLSILVNELKGLKQYVALMEKTAAAKSPGVQESVANIEVCLQRLTSMTQGMRAFVHPGRGREEPFDVNAGLEHLLRLMEHRMKPHIEIIREYGHVSSIVCASHEIMAVFGNIISNAIEAMNGHGSLRVRTSGDAEFVRVEIGDTGPGMDPETLGNLFRPFFTTKSMDEGTGLGLAQAKMIVERHRGTIRVDSVVGQGSRFTTTLAIAGPNGHERRAP